VSLPAHAAGPLRVDLALASSGDTILVDDLTVPAVYPPAMTIASQPLTQATALPNDLSGADLLIITHSTFRSTLASLVAAHAKRGQRAAVVDVQAAYELFAAFWPAGNETRIAFQSQKLHSFADFCPSLP
jgi:hypothetical protein